MRAHKTLGAVLAVACTAAVAVPVAGAVDGRGSGAGSTDLGDAYVGQAREQRAAAGAQQGAGRVPGEPTRAPFPLTGEGENFELVANIPIDFGSDIEMFGDYAFVGTYGTCTGPTPAPGTPSPGGCTPGTGGITVIDISNPRAPKVAGLFDCAGGQNDVQISPDGQYAVMAIESRNNACHPGDEGTVVLDLRDKANPKEIAFLPITGGPDATGNPRVGSHNNTLDWPYLYIDQYVARYNRIDVFDLSNPSAPAKLDGIQYGPPNPRFANTSPHDLIVDHRPDGRDLLYASSGNQTSDVIDVTNPRAPQILQRLVDPAVTFAHQSETNHTRDLTLITDEYRGGGEARACGKTATDDGPRDPASSSATADRNNLGALYFYKNNPDGTVQADGTGAPVIAGTYNLPLQTGANLNAEGCTVHIYWTAPDEDRLVTSWYGKGIRVADFEDPARTKELGWYIPEGSNVWSAKPHNGYIFTGDIERGFDVLRYTGEGAQRWPSTAGPAEVQRAEIQGATPPSGATFTASAAAGRSAPTANANPAPPRDASGSSRLFFEQRLAKARKLGGATFRRTVALPRGHRGGPVTVTVRNASGTIVSRMRFATKAGQRRLRMRARISGVAGRYRYAVSSRGGVLQRGAFKTVAGKNAGARLKAGQTLVCKIIR